MLLKEITEDYLHNLIDSVQYHHTGKTTVCIMKLHSGFEVIGFSGVVDRNKFDPKIGEKYAFENAFNKLWELEGYFIQKQIFDYESSNMTPKMEWEKAFERLIILTKAHEDKIKCRSELTKRYESGERTDDLFYEIMNLY